MNRRTGVTLTGFTNLTESSADIAITRKLSDAGRFLDIGVMDHLIVTAAGYRSFADEGLMP